MFGLILVIVLYSSIIGFLLFLLVMTSKQTTTAMRGAVGRADALTARMHLLGKINRETDANLARTKKSGGSK